MDKVSGSSPISPSMDTKTSTSMPRPWSNFHDVLVDLCGRHDRSPQPDLLGKRLGRLVVRGVLRASKASGMATPCQHRVKRYKASEAKRQRGMEGEANIKSLIVAATTPSTGAADRPGVVEDPLGKHPPPLPPPVRNHRRIRSPSAAEDSSIGEVLPDLLSAHALVLVVTLLPWCSVQLDAERLNCSSGGLSSGLLDKNSSAVGDISNYELTAMIDPKVGPPSAEGVTALGPNVPQSLKLPASVLGSCASASGAVLVPSLESHSLGDVIGIQRTSGEQKVVCRDLLTDSKGTSRSSGLSTFGWSSGSRPSSSHSSRSQQSSGSPKDTFREVKRKRGKKNEFVAAVPGVVEDPSGGHPPPPLPPPVRNH